EHLLFEEYPHQRAGAVMRGDVSRKIASFIMFGDNREYQSRAWHDHRIQFITSDQELRTKTMAESFPVRDGVRGTWRVETARKDYLEGLDFTKRLAALDDIDIYCRARLTN